ncbi:hypothetical protein NECID01_1148 [Nematocida sp. AWRm77]|nr:hypothetical protein NECID01_1148 [Nematocida sp. AWRm77]
MLYVHGQGGTCATEEFYSTEEYFCMESTECTYKSKEKKKWVEGRVCIEGKRVVLLDEKSTVLESVLISKVSLEEDGFTTPHYEVCCDNTPIKNMSNAHPTQHPTTNTTTSHSPTTHSPTIYPTHPTTNTTTNTTTHPTNTTTNTTTTYPTTHSPISTPLSTPPLPRKKMQRQSRRASGKSRSALLCMFSEESSGHTTRHRSETKCDDMEIDMCDIQTDREDRCRPRR